MFVFNKPLLYNIIYNKILKIYKCIRGEFNG